MATQIEERAARRRLGVGALGSMKTHWITAVCVGVAWQAAAAAPNVSCPAQAVLPQLDAAYHACNNGYADGSCRRFLEAFKKMTGRYDCQRSFDTGPVPAVWLAPDGALEDFVRLTWRLATDHQFKDKLYKNVSAEARSFFGSGEFRGILDGALAEEYLAKSQELARQLKRSGQ